MERTCLIPVLLLMLASCSVKEARDSCPCQVEIDLSAFAKVSRSVRVRVGATRLGRALTAADSLQLELQAVRQGALPVAVWSGLKTMQEQGDTVRVTGGQPCDSLYLFSHQGDQPPGENLRLTAVPHKQFTTVFLSLQAPEGESTPKGITVRSDANGLSLPEGRPVDGPLELQVNGEGRYLFRLPRQRSDSALVMEMEGPGGKEQPYPLGEWIRESGFDWTAADLDDLVIGMDLSQWTVRVEVLPWEAGTPVWELF